MSTELIRITRTALIVVALVSIVAGCGRSPAVKFYTLNETPVAAVPAPSELSLMIGPAVFPRSLDRNQIVTRKGDDQLNIDQFNVWGAPLRFDFLRVLGNNISAELNTDRIVVYPAAASIEIDYRVRVDILQFDGTLGENVTLRARWTIKPPGADAIAVGGFSTTQTIAGGDTSYAALVAAHSAAIAELSQVITVELRSLNKPESKPQAN